jgi:hypothetical protein
MSHFEFRVVLSDRRHQYDIPADIDLQSDETQVARIRADMDERSTVTAERGKTSTVQTPDNLTI